MSHIANQRIKKDGKTVFPGQPIVLTADALDELPPGAVSVDLDAQASNPLSSDDTPLQVEPDAKAAHDALVAAVDQLNEDAFKKDGGIRADALRDLVEELGFSVTAEDVDAVLETQGA